MIKHRVFILAIVGYCILVGLVFGRALTPSYGMMIFGDDIHRQYYFYREFFNHWISQGVFPWWNPYLFGGEPFIANPVVNIWYPPNWLFSLLPLNVAYSWHVALHVFWACLGMYLLLIQIGPIGLIRPIRPISAFVGGCIFGLSGFFMARTFAGHVDVIAAASFMPWVVGAFWRLISLPLIKLQRPQSFGQEGVIATLVFALQLLAGYQTMAFFTVIAVGIIALIYAIQIKSLIPLLRACLAGALGVALSAIQILPAAEFFGRSIRTFEFPYSWHSYGSLEWKSLLQFINPFQFGNQYTYTGPPPNFIEHSAFLGVGGLMLAMIGIISLIRHMRPIRGVFFVIAFFGLWVSLGPNAPIDLQKILWQFVPMYHYLRIPPRHLILVVFGLAGLAGIGFDRLPTSPRVLRSLIVGVIVAEMVVFARNFIELKPIPETRHDKELIALLKKDTQPYRLLQNFGAWLPQRDGLDFDGVMAYGIHSATGYDPSILRTYYEFIALASGKSGETAVLNADVQVPYLSASSASAIDMLNIKYLMVPIAYDPFANNSRYILRREDKKQEYRLYENTTVFPRFYYAQKECGTANVTSYTPNRIELTVASTCDDTLLSSENWYLGWHATIDGEEVTIGKLNNTFRTLFVLKGRHTIIFEYKPIIFLWGALISSIAILSLVFFSLRRL